MQAAVRVELFVLLDCTSTVLVGGLYSYSYESRVTTDTRYQCMHTSFVNQCKIFDSICSRELNEYHKMIAIAVSLRCLQLAMKSQVDIVPCIRKTDLGRNTLLARERRERQHKRQLSGRYYPYRLCQVCALDFFVSLRYHSNQDADSPYPFSALAIQTKKQNTLQKNEKNYQNHPPHLPATDAAASTAEAGGGTTAAATEGALRSDVAAAGVRDVDAKSNI